MKSKVQMIRWCVSLSIPFLVGAYLFSVHDIKYEHHSLFSDQWLSDNFLMTIFSGTFASFLVVILCELCNYKSSKSEQEQHIFDTNTHLFNTLFIMGKKLYDCTHGNYWNKINNINDLLPDLKDSEKNFNLELTKLGSTEYTPVIPSFGNNSLFAEYESYKNNLFGKENISENLFKLENILEGKTQVYAPESNEYVILSEMLDNVTELLTMADNFNQSLDTHCDGRFQWEKLKKVYRDKGFSIPK